MALEKQHMTQLYQLLERAEREHDQDSIAALRWAIFTVERAYNMSI